MVIFVLPDTGVIENVLAQGEGSSIQQTWISAHTIDNVVASDNADGMFGLSGAGGYVGVQPMLTMWA